MLNYQSWIELSSNTNNAGMTSSSAVGNVSNNLVLTGATTLAGAVGTKSPDRTAPLAFSSVEEYIRLLREAQRESKESSRVASLTSSRKNSPRGSPKSPPNSPNTELAATEEDLRNVYINYVNKVTLSGSTHTTIVVIDTVWGTLRRRGECDAVFKCQTETQPHHG
uniref:Uncharacterized protein n=1 Tax=Anopheles maculatus TaxID=74869 RepID=A0A182SBT1_9DIPT